MTLFLHSSQESTILEVIVILDGVIDAMQKIEPSSWYQRWTGKVLQWSIYLDVHIQKTITNYAKPPRTNAHFMYLASVLKE